MAPEKKPQCISRTAAISPWIVVAALLFFLTILGFDLLVSTKTFMITDGWWETYVWLKDSQISLYRELGLKLPPLYISLIGVATKFLGETYLSLRYFMSAVHLLAAFLLCLWLRTWVNWKGTLIGAGVAIGLVVANPVYLPKDYHTLCELLIVLILFLLGKVPNYFNKRLGVIIPLMVGGSCGLLLLTKQNLGVFFSFGVFLYLAVITNAGRPAVTKWCVASCSLFIAGYAVPPLILTLNDPSWLSIFIGNDAKGGLATVLFRFLFDLDARRVLAVAIVVTALPLVIDFHVLSDRILSSRVFRINHRKLFSWLVISTILVFALKVRSLLFALALAWPILRLYPFFREGGGIEDRHYRFLWIPLYALAYCGTQTAGYNAVSMEMLVALFVAELSCLAIAKLDLKNLPSKSFYFGGVLAFLIIVSPKATGEVGYDWWGLKAGSLFTHPKEQLGFPELDGISADPTTAKIFQTVASYGATLSDSERIFAYPSIPIIYSLLKKKPIGDPVLWFDVATLRDGKNTIAALEMAKPKYIFWLRPPSFVYAGHFRLRKLQSAMGLVDQWLVDAIRSGEYSISTVILTFDPSNNDEILPTPKLVNIPQYIAPCHTASNCEGVVNSGLTYVFQSGPAYREFIENRHALVNVEDHVFYVLTRVQ